MYVYIIYDIDMYIYIYYIYGGGRERVVLAKPGGRGVFEMS